MSIKINSKELRAVVWKVKCAKHAENVVSLLCKAYAPDELLDAAIKWKKATSKDMREALRTLPDIGSKRDYKLCDWPELWELNEKTEFVPYEYSDFHWCVIENGCNEADGKEWETGENPEEKYAQALEIYNKNKNDVEEDYLDVVFKPEPPTAEEIERYRIRSKYSDILTQWEFEAMP